MICGRCDQPIRDGERYTTYPIVGASNAGGTEYRHIVLCRKVPIQTTQRPLR